MMNNNKKPLGRARTRSRMVTVPLHTAAVAENLSCEGGEWGSADRVPQKIKKLGRTYNIFGAWSIHHNMENGNNIIRVPLSSC
jgi:hypothetical protein